MCKLHLLTLECIHYKFVFLNTVQAKEGTKLKKPFFIPWDNSTAPCQAMH